MDLLEEAGLPPGVINMLPGDGREISEVVLAAPGPGRHPLHRLHPGVPAAVADGRREHRRLPVLPAARRRDRRQGLRRRPPLAPTSTCCATALVRGAFEYSGPEVLGGLARVRAEVGLDAAARTQLIAETEALTIGDVKDFRNFTSAVIDDRSFAKHQGRDRPGARDGTIEVLAGGTDRRQGRLLRPADAARRHRPDRRDLRQRVLRPDPVRPRLRRRQLRAGR